MEKLHKVVFWIPFGLAGVSLLAFLVMLPRLPEQCGVHFSPTGSFDVYDNPLYGLYPHGVNLIVLGILWLADVLTGKVRTGFKVTEEGEAKMTLAVRLAFDWGRLLFVVFFCYWNVCVITQMPLRPPVAVAVMGLIMAGAPVLITALIVIRIRNGRKAA